jgi:hypothetical protein
MYYEAQTKSSVNYPHFFKPTVVKLLLIVLLNINSTNDNIISELKYCVVYIYIYIYIYILRCKAWIHNNTQTTSRLQEAICHWFKSA